MEDVAGALGKRDAFRFAHALRIEQAELDDVAWAENTATLTPPEVSVTPSGSGLPGPRRVASAAGPSRDELAIERGVAPRRAGPADVGRHPLTLEAAPLRPIAGERAHALQREFELLTGDRRNCTPVPAPTASAISFASTTVSTSPPTRATTGIAP